MTIHILFLRSRWLVQVLLLRETRLWLSCATGVMHVRRRIFLWRRRLCVAVLLGWSCRLLRDLTLLQGKWILLNLRRHIRGRSVLNPWVDGIVLSLFRLFQFTSALIAGSGRSSRALLSVFVDLQQLVVFSSFVVFRFWQHLLDFSRSLRIVLLRSLILVLSRVWVVLVAGTLVRVLICPHSSSHCRQKFWI